MFLSTLIKIAFRFLGIYACFTASSALKVSVQNISNRPVCFNDSYNEIDFKINCHSDKYQEFPLVWVWSNTSDIVRLQHLNIRSQNLTKLPNNLFQDRLQQFNATTSTPLCIQILSIQSGPPSLVIENEAFEGEPGCLQTLKLCSNNMQKIPTHQLQNLTSLKDLNLSYNNFSTVFAYTFQNMSNLLGLNLCTSRIRSIQPLAFFGLYQLKVLDLNFNSIRQIHVDTFLGLDALQTLNLRDLFLKNINAYQFNGLPSSVALQLTMAFKFQTDLNLSTTDTTTSLKEIQSGRCKGEMYFYTNLDAWKSSNFSFEVGEGLVEPNIEFLDQHQVLGDVTCIDIKEVPHIVIQSNVNYMIQSDTKISFERTRLTRIPSNLFTERLLEIDFRDPGTLRAMCINQLKFKDAIDGKIEKRTFDAEPWCLTTLNLINCNLKEIPIHELQKIRKLKSLTLDLNCFKNLGANSFKMLKTLKELSLRKCKIETIEPFAFVDLQNLIRLDLSGNNFFVIEPNTFAGLSRVADLIFKDMRPPNSSNASFHGISNSTNIYMKSTRITEIRLEFDIQIPREIETLVSLDFTEMFVEFSNYNQSILTLLKDQFQNDTALEEYNGFHCCVNHAEPLENQETSHFSFFAFSNGKNTSIISKMLRHESMTGKSGLFYLIKGKDFKVVVKISGYFIKFDRNRRETIYENVDIHQLAVKVINMEIQDFVIGENEVKYETNLTANIYIRL